MKFKDNEIVEVDQIVRLLLRDDSIELSPDVIQVEGLRIYAAIKCYGCEKLKVRYNGELYCITEELKAMVEMIASTYFRFTTDHVSKERLAQHLDIEPMKLTYYIERMGLANLRNIDGQYAIISVLDICKAYYKSGHKMSL